MRSLLVANRGEIALRIARTARRLGLRTVGVYSAADRDAPHRRGFDRCIGIGGERSVDSYLRIDRLIDAARASGADAVHPGYGFLAENAAFARAVIAAGLAWIGPPPEAMDAMADKGAARRRVAALGLPVLPGFDGDYRSLDELAARAAELGFPVMVKAAVGGGGRGMRRVESAPALCAALESAAREAGAAFGGSAGDAANGGAGEAAYGGTGEAAYGGVRLIVERALDDPRHVELQVFGDAHGRLIHLGERDCSVQRRHQKLIEEAPCPVLDAATRRSMGDAAVRIARDVGYVGAGTVEFLFDDGQFWFIEMNTRLQVEHPVTEALLGVDLVEWQLRVASGEPLPLDQPRALERYERGGHAIEVRLVAEDPAHDFRPAAGTVVRWQPPSGVRCDDALADGCAVTPHYDPLLAKIVAHRASRPDAVVALADALERTVCHGVTTNRGWLAGLLRGDAFAAGRFGTSFVARHAPAGIADAPSWLEALAVVCTALGVGDAALPRSWRGWTSCDRFECDLPCRVGETLRRWRVVGGRDGWVASRADGAGHRFDVPRVHPDGRLDVRIDGDERHAVFTPLDDGRSVLQCDGHETTLSDERRVAAVSARVQNAGAVHAPMHGRLIAVAAAGTRLNAGETLAVIEAMKIEHALPAPAGGTVRAVHARAGQQVAARQLLIEIDAAP